MEQTLQTLLSSLKQGITSNRQLAIMLYLAKSPEGKVDYIELVRHVVGDKPAATQSLKVLERLGFTKCERQPHDRRKRFVSLTENGRSRITAIQEASDRWWGEQATLAARDGFLTAEESAKFLGIATGRSSRGKAKEAA